MELAKRSAIHHNCNSRPGSRLDMRTWPRTSRLLSWYFASLIKRNEMEQVSLGSRQR